MTYKHSRLVLALRKTVLPLGLALSLLLCGCGSGTAAEATVAATDAAASTETSVDETTDTRATKAEFSTRSVAAAETYHVSEQVSDNLTVDADVIGYPVDGQAAVYSAEPMDFSEEEIQTFVTACGNSVVSTSTSDDGDMQYYKGQCEDNYSFTYSKGLNGVNSHPFRQFNYHDSSRYLRYYNYPIYTTEFEYYTNAAQMISWMFTEEKEFSFVTATDAEAQVRQALNCLGLSELTLLRTLYIDHEKLFEAGELLATDENYALIYGSAENNGWNIIDDWTEEDDAYMFSFAIPVESSSLAYGDWNDETATYTGCSIVVWFTRYGITCLDIQTPWEITSEAEEPTDVVSPEAALAVAIEKYSYILIYKDIKIDEVRFEYRYVQDRSNWFVKPIYTVKTSFLVENNLDVRYFEYMQINAFTGDEE